MVESETPCLPRPSSASTACSSTVDQKDYQACSAIGSAIDNEHAMLDTKAFPSSRPGFTIAAFPAFWIGTDSSTELQKEGSMLAQQHPSWLGAGVAVAGALIFLCSCWLLASLGSWPSVASIPV